MSLPPGEAFDRFHVVLVEPGDSLNVGAVARAMMNLGFRNLHLVAPPRFDAERAATSACWAVPLLQAAHIHGSLAEALAPMQQVVGFSARHGKDRPRHLLLAEWTAGLARDGNVHTALLFGPEDHGLQREHLVHCHRLIRIPSTAANPSFNLSQAVLLALYELSRMAWEAIPAERRQPADAGEALQLERLVETILARVGFYGPGTPQPIPGVVKHLLRRVEPDARELGILLGMFGKIDRALAGRIPLRDAPREDEPP
ncbi:MAG: RNA methyltransferase [Candidatus Lambdaproteobacteria bacterium]|nr:RNA methyltransferase [Candidatus Lambdaproteobacteria bacterium]